MLNQSRANANDVWNRGVFSALRTIFHMIAAVQFWYAVYYDFAFVKVPEQHHRMGNNFGGKFKYLTFLDAIIQAVYFTISLTNDFIGTNEVAPKTLPKIRKIKDFFLATFAFPLAFNVGISFWTLMAIDRELVFPKVLDLFFPSWLNHVMHTNIMVFILLEMFISFRIYPKRSKGLQGLLLFLLSYLVWLHFIKYMSGVWVYPVLDVLDLHQRIGFFAVVLLFTISVYIAGEFINNKIWTKELKLAMRKHK